MMKLAKISAIVMAILMDVLLLIPYTAPLINASSSFFAAIGLFGLFGGCALLFFLIVILVKVIEN